MRDRARTTTAMLVATGTVGTEVKVTGTDFRSGADVEFGALSSDSVVVASGTELFAIAPSGLSRGDLVDVTVRNSDGTDDTATDAFEAVAPTLDFVNGASKPSGQEGSTVVLDGAAFGDVQGNGKVLFSDGAGGTIEATIASEDDWTDTFILTTVPSGAATGDLVVETATGTSGALTFTVTSGATFSPSNITWSQTTSLPDSLAGHDAVHLSIGAVGSTSEYVHLTGGEANDDTPRTEVFYSEIGSGASLVGWNGTTSLPAARAHHASVAATPFNTRVSGDGWLYVLGGVETDGGDPVTTVFRAPLNSDGTVGAWQTTTPLPEALHSLDAVIFRSNVYVADDATVTGTRTGTVARTRVDLRSNDLVSSGWELDDDALGNGGRSKHTGLIAGGGVLISAGFYDGVKGSLGASEQQFAQIQSGCEVGSFSGATNNDNIKKQIDGVNLFNHAAVSFVDGSGTAHVMILGGDDVDLPGNRREEVWVF